MKYASGDVYEGEYQKGKKHGSGKYRSHASRNVYEGEWEDDKMHGRGILKFGNDFRKARCMAGARMSLPTDMHTKVNGRTARGMAGVQSRIQMETGITRFTNMTNSCQAKDLTLPLLMVLHFSVPASVKQPRHTNMLHHLPFVKVLMMPPRCIHLHLKLRMERWKKDLHNLLKILMLLKDKQMMNVKTWLSTKIFARS
mmetsp:Transcript_9793/g.17383  ORF Transcript_9793/g.17383 Transcript_9793/m.17383 type:complete len:198 (-) Transcript_9793:1665-2258(-)